MNSVAKIRYLTGLLMPGGGGGGGGLKYFPGLWMNWIYGCIMQVTGMSSYFYILHCGHESRGHPTNLEMGGSRSGRVFVRWQNIEALGRWDIPTTIQGQSDPWKRICGRPEQVGDKLPPLAGVGCWYVLQIVFCCRENSLKLQSLLITLLKWLMRLNFN